MAITRVIRFRFRRGTAAEWSAANPILEAGEPGLETDTGNIKYGDGATPWATLDYFTAEVSFSDISGAPGDNAALAALFAAKAPLESPAFTGVPTAPTAAIGASTGQLATTAFVQSAVGAHVQAQRLVDGAATLELADLGKQIVFVAGGTSLTLPEYSSVPIPDGAIFLVVNFGGAPVTILRDAGVALYDTALTNADLPMAFGQWAWLLKAGTNLWTVWRS